MRTYIEKKYRYCSSREWSGGDCRNTAHSTAIRLSPASRERGAVTVERIVTV